MTGGAVRYNYQTGRVTGDQGMQITGPGTTEFAQTFDFDTKLQTGTATGFSSPPAQRTPRSPRPASRASPRP